MATLFSSLSAQPPSRQVRGGVPAAGFHATSIADIVASPAFSPGATGEGATRATI
jgi:hypothetical protein